MPDSSHPSAAWLLISGKELDELDLHLTVLENNPIKISERKNGLNDGGSMAFINSSENGLVYFRGVMGNGMSGIAAGELKGNIFTPRYPLIYPAMRPKTDNGIYYSHYVWGYEDPTLVEPGLNFLEPGRWGLLMTEAYIHQFLPFRIHANLLYMGLESGVFLPVLTPGQAHENGLSQYFSHVDMVKEAHITGDGKHILMEVAADMHSHLVIGDIDGDQVVNLRPWILRLTEDSWYDNHLSTVDRPLPFAAGLDLVVFNGQRREGERWAIGLAVIQGNQLRYVSPDPVITPPQGVFVQREPVEIQAPGGKETLFATQNTIEILSTDVTGQLVQDVAFGSQATWDTGEHVLTIWYHAQDQFPCSAKVKVELIV